jgi:hypothetical protein
MKSRISVVASAVMLAAAGLLWAEPQQAPAQAPQSRATMGTMMGSATAPGGPGSMMMEDQTIMARRQGMMDEIKKMDARLDALVQTMDQAKGNKRVDAMAAVLRELVAQRKELRDSMLSMQPMMMQSMMKHMQMGMMHGMSESLSSWPFMSSTEGAGGHHMHK